MSESDRQEPRTEQTVNSLAFVDSDDGAAIEYNGRDDDQMQLCDLYCGGRNCTSPSIDPDTLRGTDDTPVAGVEAPNGGDD